MASVDLVSPQGTTRTVTELGSLQHLVNARGYTVAAGTYADAVATLSGWANHPTVATEAEVVADPSTPLGAALRAAFEPAFPPAVVRIGRSIPSDSAAAWSTLANGLSAGSGTATDGIDALAGPYVRLTTTTAGGGGTFRAGRDLAVQLTKGKAVSFLLRTLDTNFTVLDLYATFGGLGVINSTRWNRGTSSFTPGRWYRITLHPRDYDTLSGTPDFVDLRSVSLGITAAAGQVATVDIADFRVHSNSAQGSVSFMFDDARLDTYTEAFPRLAAKGWAGNVAVEYTVVGGTGSTGPNSGARATLAQLKEMYAAGWDISGHHTTQMPTLTAAQQVGVHQASKAWLATNGFERGSSIWAFPGGVRNDAVDEIARRFWRTLRRVSTFSQVGIPHVYEPSDPPIYYMGTGKTLAQAKAMVDRVAASGGSLVLVFHSLVTTTTAPEDWLISDFQALLDYIATANVAVKAPSQVWTA